MTLHLGDFIEDRLRRQPVRRCCHLGQPEGAHLAGPLHPDPARRYVTGDALGLEDGSEHTLEEVGQSFQVTRERIRQIEAKALRKLRHPSRSRKLKAFVDGVKEM